MGRRKGPERVQYSLRCTAEIFTAVHEIAKRQGTDINGVINAILLEFVPVYDQRVRAQQCEVEAIPSAPNELDEFREHTGLFEALTAWRLSNRTSNRVVEEAIDKMQKVEPAVRVKLVEIAKELHTLLGRVNLFRSVRNDLGSWVGLTQGVTPGPIDVETLIDHARVHKLALINRWRRLIGLEDVPV